MKRNFPLHVHLSTLFLIISLSTGGIIAAVGYKMSYDMLESSASELTLRVSREVLSKIEGIIKPADVLTELLSYDDLCDAKDFNSRWYQLGMMRESLSHSNGFSSLFIGYEDGDFFLLRRVRTEAERQIFSAPQDTQYIVQSIERKLAKGRFIYLNAMMERLREDDRPNYVSSYDPRSRSWFKLGITSVGTVTTSPYLFFADRKVGLTVARRAENGKAVVAADILLETLSDTLRQQHITESSQVALVNGSGLVIAHENTQQLVSVPDQADAKPRLRHLDELGIPAMVGLGSRIQNAQSHEVAIDTLDIKGESWRVLIQPLLLEGSEPLYLVVAIPSRELFASALELRSTALSITLLIILISVPLIWTIARAISRSLRILAREAEAIRRFEFTKPIKLRSLISEVGELAKTMDLTKSTIRRFLDVTQAVSAEDNFERLLPMLLLETMQAGSAEAGVLYLVNHEHLHPSAALTLDGEDASAGLKSIAIEGAPGLLRWTLTRQTAQAGKMLVGEIEEAGLQGLLSRVSAPYSMVVPLLNRRRQLLGVMLLQRQTLIDNAELSFVSALASTASSSLEARELIKAQKELFEAFIQMIAGAIDAKSPYTGGHCARVPELTKMLAQAACEADSGPFRNFALGEDEWEAVHIAAWLHDCGKVTTPEYVIDKATKLETIYNRIHEVRTRFEVLKRDAEIACLKAQLAGIPEAEARAQLEAQWQQLDEDFAFVAHCNEGSELMDASQHERLEQIGARTWWRTLDDRLGLSHEELERKQAISQTLPALEPLLANKAEHCFIRRSKDRIPADNRWGFNMRVPELLYNRGELYNLSVGRGTLSAEERYKINEHMVQTIIMLSQLPFPKYLRHVPEIAGGHHEKMDGSGYPRGLKKDDMTPVARMMAVADIFEALTAVDRPYKKGKTLSESIRIMGAMARDQHIDTDIFALFLRSGVYRIYAERFMRAEQIDDVDIEAHLAD